MKMLGVSLLPFIRMGFKMLSMTLTTTPPQMISPTPAVMCPVKRR